MIALYLKAADEAAMRAAVPFAVGRNEDGNDIWITATHDFSFDPIGSVVVTPGVFDDSGKETTPPVMDKQFHANLLLHSNDETVDEAMQATIRVGTTLPSPATPMRKWAGR